MSKIEKYHEHVSHYAYVTYFKDEGMYKVKASVHVNIEEQGLYGKFEAHYLANKVRL